MAAPALAWGGIRILVGVAASAHASPGSAQSPLTGRLIAFLAAATGLSVANLYYAQPLLQLMARSFSLSTASAGIVSYFIGGACGSAISLLLYRPLGWSAAPLVAFGLLALGALGQAIA